MDANLTITALTDDGVSILGFLSDGNGNGRKDLDDWETLAARPQDLKIMTVLLL